MQAPDEQDAWPLTRLPLRIARQVLRLGAVRHHGDPFLRQPVQPDDVALERLGRHDDTRRPSVARHLREGIVHQAGQEAGPPVPRDERREQFDLGVDRCPFEVDERHASQAEPDAGPHHRQVDQAVVVQPVDLSRQLEPRQVHVTPAPAAHHPHEGRGRQLLPRRDVGDVVSIGQAGQDLGGERAHPFLHPRDPQPRAGQTVTHGRRAAGPTTAPEPARPSLRAGGRNRRPGRSRRRRLCDAGWSR